MSILTRIRDVFRDPPEPLGWSLSTRETITASYPTYQIGKPVWPERDPYTYQQDALRKIALVFRCVGVTANAVASAPIRVYAEDDTGERTILPRHPMRQLMTQPNPQMRETRFLAFVAMVMATSGFCVVEKVRSSSGRVVELWPMRSDWLRPVPRTAAPPDWEYRIPGYTAPFTLPASDVIVFPYADRPDGSPTGIGPLEAALREFGLLNTMTDFLKAFFDGGAMPVYALVPRENDTGLGSRSTMTQAEADYIKAKWVSRYGGMHRAVEPAILAGIEDVKKLSFDFNELAYTDLRDLADAAICQAFGVSPMLVDAMVGMKHSTYSNKMEARTGFYEDTITPLWARMDDILTLGLLSEFETRPGISLEFDTSKIPALQEDRNAKAAWVVQATLGGAISVHTLHRELSLPLPEGTDWYLAGASMLPDLAPVRAITGGVDHRLERLAPERREQITTRSRDAIARIADVYEPSLTQFYREQGERIIAAVAERADASPIEARTLDAIDWDDEHRRIVEIIQRIYEGAGAAAYNAASQELLIMIDWTLTNPRIQLILDDLAKRIVGMTETTREAVRKIVGAGLDEGVDMRELAKRLRTEFEDMSKIRSRVIARTESMVAYGKATRLAYQESGVVAAAEIRDNPNHTESYKASDGLTCATRHGLIVPLDRADFHIEADHPNGSAVLLPVLGTPLGQE